MSDVSEARKLIHEAFPIDRYGTAQAAIWAAYRKLKFRTERRVRAIWNGEARRIEANEMRELENAALGQARRNFIDAKNRIAVLREEINARHTHYHSNPFDLDG